jgi:radical SAM protein with 4Fe4S-binding SPASM domain
MKFDKRTELFQVLPLETPFTLFYTPTTVCNFRCGYCYNSLNKKVFPETEKQMPFFVFKKSIDDISVFKEKIKNISLVGFGEPLLNPHIVDMVAYAKKKNISERVEIITNGSLLTYEMSKRLIDAGLDRLQISLQGLDATTYKNICNTFIVFEKLIDNIKYFFEKKQNCILRVKILNIACYGKENERKFHDIFDSISDYTDIEYYAQYYPSKDMNYYQKNNSMTITGGNLEDVMICPYPFYSLCVWPSGNISPCCYYDPPLILGNLLKKSLKEIWNGTERKEFLHAQLLHRKQLVVCQNCLQPVYDRRDGNDLDKYRNELLVRLF